MVRRFFADLIGAYGDGVRSMMGLPWLFAVLIGLEFVQHIVEVRIGLYASAAAAHALSNDGTRLAFGWVKMISVYLGGFFVIRYLVGRGGNVMLAPVGRAIIRYLPYLIYSLALFALVFYAPQLFPASNDTAIRATIGLVQLAVEPLLILWIVSSATDGLVRTPFQSACMTGLLYWWALALFFIGRIPVNAVHQILARSAVGHDGSVLWAMLVADAISVGLVISVIPALYVRIARLIGERRMDVLGRGSVALAA